MSFKSPFKKKSKEDQQVASTSAIVEQDYIPYACHFDHETLLTKNGELMQTIKIVGFSFESIESEGADLRETIRAAIAAGLNSTSFAVWFHTIRRRKNLSPGGQYKEFFPRVAHEAWNNHNDWQHKYTNELFITIVRDGETSSLKSPLRFVRSLVISRDLAAREDHLREMHEELNAATGRMLDKLKVFGARKLSVFKKDGVHYSEPLRFLGKILKLREEEVSMEDNDLSDTLASHKVQFGHDALEVRAPDESRRFGAILTVKEYHEISLSAIDKFLQLPEEFIVTQTMDFINPAKAVKSFSQQHRITQISKDTRLARVSGLEDIMQSMTGSPTDFGEHQITIFMIADDLKHLNRYLENTIDVLSSLGIVVMREDLRLEEAYWSQLPGNFAFLRRLKPINSARIGGFANLSNYPAGKAADNHWGPAVTVFHTAAQTPYFFNFHNGSVGHTSIIGPYGAGKTVLLNFLLSESRKFDTKLFFFDYQHNSEVFIHALGGKYHHVTPGGLGLPVNPLQLEPNDVNRNFVSLWLEALYFQHSQTFPTENEERLLGETLDQFFTLPQEQRTLAGFVALLSQTDARLAGHFGNWHSGGALSGVFGHAEDALQFDGLVHGFDMTGIVEDWYSVPAVMLYLLHRIMHELDGTPAIIVMDEAWNLLDNPFFAPRIQGWLEAVSARNALVIFATESIEGASQSAISGEVFSKIATQIYLPDPAPGDAYTEVFGLNENEFDLLSLMSPEQRHFLLKKGEEAIVAQLNLVGLEKLLQVLSSQQRGREVLSAVIAERGTNPEQWLPEYHRHMSVAHG
ncbi:MAG: hypothetical protein FJX23_05215 [Alphaproteobacteria bacterium]|nr:hypothetical protein [Alphaproteobacteria bacterium]